VPVLLDDVLRVIDPQPGQTIVDCTLGLGGHSAAMLERVKPDGRVIATDFDPGNIADARVVLQRVKGREGTVRFDLVHSNFAGLPKVLAELGVMLGDDETGGGVDAVLADVGVASTQIDEASRGFSYRKEGPLDMRMDPTRGQPASVLINRLSEREIAEALLEFGDETDAEKIARLIVERRAVEPIVTTQALTAIVCAARDFTLQRAAGAKLHPAARTFQALRILVNRELANLERLLVVLPGVLKRAGANDRGGIGAIITFHSGEDRLVKRAFREGLKSGVYSEISEEPIVASEAEAKANPRARSAKLRWARRA
jgi:16S rRNA (cytosine1402-N4)-methyltransferase